MCQICKGTNSNHCPICGKDEVKTIEEKCYYCGGTGKVIDIRKDREIINDCPLCDGTGTRVFYE